MGEARCHDSSRPPSSIAHGRHHVPSPAMTAAPHSEAARRDGRPPVSAFQQRAVRLVVWDGVSLHLVWQAPRTRDASCRRLGLRGRVLKMRHRQALDSLGHSLVLAAFASFSASASASCTCSSRLALGLLSCLRPPLPLLLFSGDDAAWHSLSVSSRWICPPPCFASPSCRCKQHLPTSPGARNSPGHSSMRCLLFAYYLLLSACCLRCLPR